MKFSLSSLANTQDLMGIALRQPLAFPPRPWWQRAAMRMGWTPAARYMTISYYWRPLPGGWTRAAKTVREDAFVGVIELHAHEEVMISSVQAELVKLKARNTDA